MVRCLSFLGSLATATAVHAEPVPAAVSLAEQRIALDEGKGELTAQVSVQNHLEVALTSVEVGWLLAPSAEALAAVTDPGALYLASDDPKHANPPPGVVVIRRAVSVSVAPRSAAPASFQTILAGPAPAIYRAHVLGYTLADANLALLLRLLNAKAAADERAAVDFFALAGTLEERQAARARLDGGRWLPELEQQVAAPVPQRPSARELHERVLAVRAMGVVGGERAERVLEPLREREDLTAFDELLRVLQIDRLRGNRLETPLAFAVPPAAKSFKDLVDAALEDARAAQVAPPTAGGQRPMGDPSLPDATTATTARPIADGPSPRTGADGGRPATDAPAIDGGSPTSDDGGPMAAAPTAAVRPFDLREQLLGLAVVVGAAVITLWLLRRTK